MKTGKKVSTFQERFIELADRSPLTDTELAKDLKVSKQTISSWRIGRRSPKEPTIILIAQYFHVSIEWLMGFDVDEDKEEAPQNTYVPQTDEARILAKGFDRMPEAERKRAVDMAKLIFAAYADLFKEGNDDET